MISSELNELIKNYPATWYNFLGKHITLEAKIKALIRKEIGEMLPEAPPAYSRYPDNSPAYKTWYRINVCK